MLTAAERWGGGADERPFLPRAFSVMRAHEDGTLDFLLEDVGPGTNRLCELDEGDELLVLGPLGNGFRPPRQGRRPILVGGGVGHRAARDLGRPDRRRGTDAPRLPRRRTRRGRRADPATPASPPTTAPAATTAS